MSASTEKKLRQAAREAGTDKKTLALEKEAKEKAKQKRRWTLGTIAVCLLVALILLLNSSLLFKTTALTVGDEKYTAIITQTSSTTGPTSTAAMPPSSGWIPPTALTAWISSPALWQAKA